MRQDFTESFNRVRASFAGRSCTCKTTEAGAASTTTDRCCREQCGWPSAEEVFCAMNSDMRQRLAKMTKEVQAERRKLDEIKHYQQHSGVATTTTTTTTATTSTMSPLRSLSTVSSALTGTPPPFDMSNGDASSMRFDDAETNSTHSTVTGGTTVSSSTHNSAPPIKHKFGADAANGGGLVAMKKAKTLVEYIFASKKRLSESGTDAGPSSQQDETSVSSHPSMSSPSIKLEFNADEDMSSQDLFGGNAGTVASTSAAEAHRLRRSKHHSAKHKRPHRSREHRNKHRRGSEARERKRRIDARCTLTAEHLDGLADKTRSSRVLTAMGGLFYAGGLSAVQPPDVYAVTLDGERGNRPHIMSREEILRDAVSFGLIIIIFCNE